jgi:undecaprenyl-diphosphatase
MLQNEIDSFVKSPVIVAAALIVGGMLMIGVEKYTSRKDISLESLAPADASIIGLGQALALIRGVSRSGITIVAGMASGLSRSDAARYAFLLGIPIITGGFIVSLLDVQEGGGSFTQPSLIAGFVSAFLTGLFAIRFLLNYLRTRPLYIFAYYRFALAGLIFVLTLLNYV